MTRLAAVVKLSTSSGADLIGRDDRRVEAMLAQHLPNHLGDLTGGAVLGRRRHQHSCQALRSLG
jgi:hypothetical protein